MLFNCAVLFISIVVFMLFEIDEGIGGESDAAIELAIETSL